MSIPRVITLASTLTFTMLALITTSAGARATRELETSFGSSDFNAVEYPSGVAVDLETGNVYVTDVSVQESNTPLYVFGPTGGEPAGGVPSEITGVHFAGSTDGAPAPVAVDNSCYEHEPRLTGKACEEYDPAYGDVYVMDTNFEHDTFLNGHYGIDKLRFNAGKYERIGEIEFSFAPEAITVDSRGDIWVDQGGINRLGEQGAPLRELKKAVEKVVSGGKEEFQERLEEVVISQSLERDPQYVAVDDLGDVYVGNFAEDSGPSEGWNGVAKFKLGATGNVISDEVLAPNVLGASRPVAVDRSSGSVYVGDGSEVAEYGPAGALQLSFGSTEPLGGSLGKAGEGATAIAVNDETGRVYVVNALHHDVDVFGPVLGPPVFEAEQPAVSSVGRTNAVIAGTVDPESGQANYYFEYVAEEEYGAGGVNPYRNGRRTAVGALAGGHSPETIERVVLSGLRPGTVYHYRMVVSNATATVAGPDETFTTARATPPTVATGAAVEVGATGVTLTGIVGPRGLLTSYVFEVGTDTGYSGAQLFGNAGSGTGEVSVSVGLQYLAPGTTYHFRLVATSFDGTTYGQDVAFTTPAVASAVVQPSSEPLITSPVVQFPSIAGAITSPLGAARPRRAPTNAQKLAAALHACRKQEPGKTRTICEARARTRYKHAAKTNNSKKR
jgi:hypothetical protein